MTTLVTHCKSWDCSIFFYQLSVCIDFFTLSFKIYNYLKGNLYCFKRVLTCALLSETNKHSFGALRQEKQGLDFERELMAGLRKSGGRVREDLMDNSPT